VEQAPLAAVEHPVRAVKVKALAMARDKRQLIVQPQAQDQARVADKVQALVVHVPGAE
jgi:hypothetical protein